MTVVPKCLLRYSPCHCYFQLSRSQNQCPRISPDAVSKRATTFKKYLHARFFLREQARTTAQMKCNFQQPVANHVIHNVTKLPTNQAVLFTSHVVNQLLTMADIWATLLTSLSTSHSYFSYNSLTGQRNFSSLSYCNPCSTKGTVTLEITSLREYCRMGFSAYETFCILLMTSACYHLPWIRRA